jgi:hypothetical protein
VSTQEGLDRAAFILRDLIQRPRESENFSPPNQQGKSASVRGQGDQPVAKIQFGFFEQMSVAAVPCPVI